MADRRWEDAMGSLFDASKYTPTFPEPRGADVNLPWASVDSVGPGNPRVMGGVNYGDVGIEGRYQQRERPEYGAMIKYRRSF